MTRALVVAGFAACLSACSPAGTRVEDKVVEAVRAAAGDVTKMRFSRVAWCPNGHDGAKAAFVAAIGDTTAGDVAGMGGYLVEVLEDGTVMPAVKANALDAPSYDAQRIDRTYCDGKLVVRPYQAMRTLEEMR
jgi:hypothetical protein